MFERKQGRITLAAAAVAVLVAVLGAGCGSDDGDGAADAGSGAFVSVAGVDGTDVLVDAEGRALYTADVEEDGEIRCVDACESFWVPVEADQGDIDALDPSLGEDLGLVERPDGASQLSYDGLPLYSFAEEEAGELTGDGFTDDFQGTHFVWEAARVEDAPAPPSTPDDSEDDGGFGY